MESPYLVSGMYEIGFGPILQRFGVQNCCQLAFSRGR